MLCNLGFYFLERMLLDKDLSLNAWVLTGLGFLV